MAVSPADFYRLLAVSGIDFFTGVPDSLLNDFCSCLDDTVPAGRHIIAANEGNAVAIAAGYHLGTGRLPLVYMQNSGLGNAVNPLMSLCDPELYSIPMLVMVGWRGEPGTHDAIQHVKDGRIQLDLLRAMALPFEVLSGEDGDIPAKTQRAIGAALAGKRPFVLLVRKGAFAPYHRAPRQADGGLLTREEALEIVLDSLGADSITISTTGKTSREIFEIRERRGQGHSGDFLTVGSMGHCSSIALGVSLARPGKLVTCIDGDGALIMHMGSLATAGMLKPGNFRHVLINNRVHESVGGQPTAAGYIDVPALARACGYRGVFSTSDGRTLPSLFDRFLKSEGPAFIEIVVRPGARPDLGRPEMAPVDNKRAFMEFLSRK